MIFEFLQPEIKFDFLFWSLLVAYRLNFPKKFEEYGRLKCSKELMVQSRFTWNAITMTIQTKKHDKSIIQTCRKIRLGSNLEN